MMETEHSEPKKKGIHYKNSLEWELCDHSGVINCVNSMFFDIQSNTHCPNHSILYSFYNKRYQFWTKNGTFEFCTFCDSYLRTLKAKYLQCKYISEIDKGPSINDVASIFAYFDPPPSPKNVKYFSSP